jgi:hypothetical protein
VVELGSERFIVREDKRGALQLFDDLGHREGFAGAGDAEEDLIFFACMNAGDEFGDGAGLVALGLVGGRELKVHPYRIVY